MVAEIEDPYVWYRDPVGQRMLETEKKELAEILPRLYGFHLALIGEPELAPLVTSSLISHQMLLNPSATLEPESLSGLKGLMEALPFQNDSLDVVVLSHALERAQHPHEVLRETHRVLIPEGHVVITGLNPFSLWGAWYSVKHFKKQASGIGKMLSPNRIKDWLKLLNFQIVGARMFYFRPPLKRVGLNKKLQFMERWGRKCWPFMGGAYALVAVKRVAPLTPMRARFKPSKPIWQPAPAIPKPTTTAQNKNDKYNS